MKRCSNCRRECSPEKCLNCYREVCKTCSYSELHECPNITYEIEQDMNKFKEKIHLINT